MRGSDRLALWSTALVAALLAAVVRADAAPPCAAIPNDGERLSCYDTAFGRPAGPGVPPAPETAPVSAAPTATTVAAGSATSVAAAGSQVTPAVSAGTSVAPAEPERDFGLTEAQKQQRAAEKAPLPPREAASIESSVTMVSNRRTGEFVYTLANGQVWVQSEANQNGYLRDGAGVTIKRAALGSYKLVSGPVSTRVRRVQ
jgi:hypothetical protein